MLSLPLIVTAILIVTASAARSTLGRRAHHRPHLHAGRLAHRSRRRARARRELDYVQAARLRGERSPYIMFSEILPNVMSPIVVEFTVRLGYAIFAVATLTFIGFGVQPPSPDWAAQIQTSTTRSSTRTGG